ncbi:hypothetical protein ABKN59_001476 [Abortiporus biennis]
MIKAYVQGAFISIVLMASSKLLNVADCQLPSFWREKIVLKSSVIIFRSVIDIPSATNLPPMSRRETWSRNDSYTAVRNVNGQSEILQERDHRVLSGTL